MTTIAGMKNGVQLITYVDRFGGGGLPALCDLLTGPLSGVFTGVHLLPFYSPYDGIDAGYDPIDHGVVDPRLGTWGDVKCIAETHDVTVDLIVNHASDQTPQFIDFLLNGDASEWAGMFLRFDTVFPDGASEDELRRLYRPRPGLPFSSVDMADGSQRLMWTTFTSHQIDLDVSHPKTREYLRHVLDQMAGAGVSQVRLDAIGYAVKTPGTSCFMTPETREFIAALGSDVRDRGMQSLLEIHSHYLDQVATSANDDRVYDFALPALVLQGLATGSANALRRWLAISPRNAETVLDTHDGIGVVDIGPSGGRAGLLTNDQVDDLVEGIHMATGGESRRATGAAASNLDLYQVNSTYFSALGSDEDAYLVARLIQFLSPGIPQVYYAGLLAAENDMLLLEATCNGRDINRPYFSRSQIEQALERPVVKRLLGLARFRNNHPAFAGGFILGESDPGSLRVGWHGDGSSIDAVVDLANRTFALVHSIHGNEGTITDWDEFETIDFPAS